MDNLPPSHIQEAMVTLGITTLECTDKEVMLTAYRRALRLAHTGQSPHTIEAINVAKRVLLGWFRVHQKPEVGSLSNNACVPVCAPSPNPERRLMTLTNSDGQVVQQEFVPAHRPSASECRSSRSAAQREHRTTLPSYTQPSRTPSHVSQRREMALPMPFAHD